METSLIEQLDKSRYNLQKWFTIGFGLWFASIILKNFMEFHILNVFTALLALLGTPIFAIYYIKFIKLQQLLKANHKLIGALDNELYVLNSYKSFKVSALVALGMSALLLVISAFTQLSASLVAQLIFYSGVMAGSISGLYYNR